MAATCPKGLNIERLQAQIRSIYDCVAHSPEGDFHFHRGLDYACELLHYHRGELQSLPKQCTDRFAGVGNPHRIGRIRPGETVLDIGCGAGMDLLIAARHVSPHGKAIGVDMTLAMCERARAAAVEAGVWKIVDVRPGVAEELPVANESVDVVISNGVINLSPDKRRAFQEIRRVLRPGGRLYLADVVVQRELSLAARSDADLWAA
ncbi:MAG: methyltransferase domain-containing protein [Deltaproteobacteria bacterium]|nr:methyltransferase domain-containing protein [Deltaproteobacteria bacterium]